MEFAGAVLGAVGAADICIRLGRNLIERYNDYHDAPRDLAEQRLRIQIAWLRAEQELTLLHNTAGVLAQELETILFNLLEVLESKLEKASKALTRSIKSGKWAFILKKSLEDTVGELEKWLNMFQPIWFLITRTSNKVVDQMLDSQMARVSIHGPPPRQYGAVMTMKGIRDAAKNTDTGPSVWISPGEIVQSQYHGTPADYPVCEMRGRGVVVDSMRLDPQRDTDGAARDVRDLARLLAMSDPDIFGILACRGIVVRHDNTGRIVRFDFVFEIPVGLHSPRRLRSILQHQEHAQHALDERVSLAKHLSRSVVFVHSSGFVHKNIRPETIAVFQKKDQSTRLGIPFLVGFEMFRAAEGRTYLTGDDDWEKNLYRHPSRQGTLPEDAYNMQHDIYSLGVCLLEIGLWSPFVVDGMLGHVLAHIARHLNQKDAKRKATDIKRELVQMARERLPSLMGWKYTDVVLSCLTCLDKDGSFGQEDEFRDKDGIIVGVRYIEKVFFFLPFPPLHMLLCLSC